MNIKKQLHIIGNAQDKLLLVCLRQAILDNFWSREQFIVQGSLNLVHNSLVDGKVFGFGGKVYSALGPFLVRDCSAEVIACIMMQRSLKAGKNAKIIQFETLQKTRSCHANYLHVSCFGTGDLTMQDNGNGSRVSHAVTNLFWFKRLMAGCHRCIGDIWLPNKAVSTYVIGGCSCVLERDWNDFWEGDKEDFSRSVLGGDGCMCDYCSILWRSTRRGD